MCQGHWVRVFGIRGGILRRRGKHRRQRPVSVPGRELRQSQLRKIPGRELRRRPGRSGARQRLRVLPQRSEHLRQLLVQLRKIPGRRRAPRRRTGRTLRILRQRGKHRRQIPPAVAPGRELRQGQPRKLPGRVPRRRPSCQRPASVPGRELRRKVRHRTIAARELRRGPRAPGRPSARQGLPRRAGIVVLVALLLGAQPRGARGRRGSATCMAHGERTPLVARRSPGAPRAPPRRGVHDRRALRAAQRIGHVVKSPAGRRRCALLTRQRLCRLWIPGHGGVARGRFGAL